MAKKQMCKNREVLDLLPWYVTGSLPADKNAMVEKHLAECETCSKEVEKMKWLTEAYELTEKHINPVILTIYAENNKELSKPIIQQIKNHLAVCPECQKELEILTEVNRSLDTQPAESQLSGIIESILSFFSQLFLKPAFAYILVLLLLYPAWLGIFRKNDRPMQVNKAVNIKDHFVLKQNNQRGYTNRQNVFELADTKGLFTLSFHLPDVDKKDFTYKARIIDEKNNVKWQTSDLQFIDDYGNVLLLLNNSNFRTGPYTLIIDQKNTETGQTADEYTYVFKIRLNE
ncbi:MAG: zf-HC2 domain-containing protein [Bacteroidales bacterium]|nr:zf-HC2 domain-containing protein [Bacteroidales bacterium]